MTSEHNGADRVLLCGVNWLGDSVMTMPAIQRFAARFPDTELSIVVKPALEPLWTLHPAVRRVFVYGHGLRGVWRAGRELRAQGFSRAYVFPNSPRSALIPYLARIPERIGVRGHQRAWTLTRLIPRNHASDRYHQAWEYVRILGLSEDEPLEAPALSVPDALLARQRERLSVLQGRIPVALLPGAAYGPSKRWPTEHFAEVGRRIQANGQYGVALFGSPAETQVCNRIASDIDGPVANFTGNTTLPEYAALLRLCRAAVSNDSGGMHLAAAMGIPVVAVFGLTDPGKTGPLGKRTVVVAPDGIRGTRDIPRHSAAAVAALAGITPDRVWQKLQPLLTVAP